jgi:leader peptidase (prepilin peptidase)/N-methyltransferase
MGPLAAAVFEARTWSELPFHFWTVTFFVFGTVVGSFLNVCIYRMPRGESLVTPGSHCPACNQAIAWYHNLPILAWLLLRGRCARCGAGISARYVAVEALTGLCFAGVWARHSAAGPWVAVLLSLFVAALIVATFIDLEHLIIPDEITLGGAAGGLVAAVVAPGIHGQAYVWPALKAAAIGAGIGAGIVWGMVEIGKLLFGRQRFPLAPGSRIEFTETDLHLPDRVLPYEDIFYRHSDTLVFHAHRLELEDRCYRGVDVRLRLRLNQLTIGDESVDASTVKRMEATTDEVTVPREAMGFGDVKFMAAIGAFTGWEGVLFTLLGSSVAGLALNIILIAVGRRQWSARIPFGPYLAAAALAWVLGADGLFRRWIL